jgi:hypothetical protein
VRTTSAPATQTTAPKSTTTTGGSNGGQAGQRLTVPQVIEAVLTSSDPATVCGADYVTQHYLSAAYGGKQGCIQAQDPKNAAASVQIKHLQAPDPTFTPLTSKGTVIPQGGLYDGEKLTISLVQEDGTWKVDALKSNAPVGP